MGRNGEQGAGFSSAPLVMPGTQAEREVRIEAATWRDLIAVWRLERAVFPHDAYDPITLWLLLAWPGNVVLKAMQGESLVGFVAGDHPLGSYFSWIVTLGVAAQARQRGVGARLLAECESRLTTSILRLMVRESNAPAIALYQKSGYRFVRREPGYYGDGEAGLRMEKTRPSGDSPADGA